MADKIVVRLTLAQIEMLLANLPFDDESVETRTLGNGRSDQRRVHALWKAEKALREAREHYLLN